MTTRYTKAHATDPAKVQAIIAAIESGADVPPIIVYRRRIISGNHRYEAGRLAGRAIRVVTVSTAWMTEALENMGLREFGKVWDYEALVVGLRKVAPTAELAAVCAAN